MARIPEAELQRLKDEVSVQRLVEASGLVLKKSGKDFLGRCAFHEDAEASLVVTPAKNLWHCFGCQIGGGPIDWVIKQRGVSFRHAVELLRADPSLAAGLSAASAAPPKRRTVRSLPAPVALNADDQALLAQIIGYYHERLKQSPEALAYLASRGLAHPQLVDTFQLGVADRTLGLRLPDKSRKDGAAIRERLQRIGLIRDSGHEHFNGRCSMRVDRRAAMWWRSTGASCATICVPARPSICTCRVRMRACSTWRACAPLASAPRASAT